MNLLEKAILLAVQAHAGQLDKSGQPYIRHPLRLMTQMDTEKAQLVALLHDVLEDTPTTLNDLRQLGLPEDVLTAIQLLTHDKANEPYEVYVRRLKVNPLARQVKLADLQDNMNIRRLSQVTTKDSERLNKYLWAWHFLTNDAEQQPK